jgi:hypothetical protein
MPLILELRSGSNRLGRSDQNDHRFDDPAVSDIHCEVVVKNDVVIVRDLGSTNGTFIDRRPVGEAALSPGQTLRIGTVEMVLDGPAVRLAIPELAPPEPIDARSVQLADGYAACLNHENRHAAWVCVSCGREYCDQCIRKLRRVGGASMRFCPACSNKCKLTAWSEMMKRKKRSVLAVFADKVRTRLLQTTRLFTLRKGGGASPEKPRTRKTRE